VIGGIGQPGILVYGGCDQQGVAERHGAIKLVLVQPVLVFIGVLFLVQHGLPVVPAVDRVANLVQRADVGIIVPGFLARVVKMKSIGNWQENDGADNGDALVEKGLLKHHSDELLESVPKCADEMLDLLASALEFGICVGEGFGETVVDINGRGRSGFKPLLEGNPAAGVVNTDRTP
jgi:hypothetical protein